MSLLLLAACLLVVGCAGPPDPLEPPEVKGPRPGLGGDVVGPRLSTITEEPVVRVRIARRADRLVIGALSRGDAVTVSEVATDGGEGNAHRFQPPVTVTTRGGAFRIRDAAGRSGRWRAGSLAVRASGGVAVDAVAYPGTMRLRVRGGGVDVVNHVPLEAYLPGVLEKELFSDWHPRAFEAQAIAARSYALFEMAGRSASHYDVESTVRSQVYGGASTNPRARAAVRATRGEVLAFEGRIVPAFFSSTTGGRGQDAAVAFPNVADIAPLRGRDRGEWGSISPSWRWGPVRRQLDTLSRRLAGWGAATGHEIASLNRIAAIAVTSRSRSGRPAMFRVTDESGARYALRCEAFRFACNHAADGDPSRGLPAIPADQRLKSSDLSITREGGAVVFRGRGYGHGVGLGQWGAQHLATAGYDARAIVGFYYPEAVVTRLY
ncbi:MAG: SpoIID/LytB domain-containing protein [Phycisphaeraceae bacterium]